MTRLQRVLDAIDAANVADPTREDGQPAAWLYGRRMTAEVNRLFPDASEPLQIAARGQHIERWVLKRKDFPEGRTGYLAWRAQLGKHHADRVESIMIQEGYEAELAHAAGRMIRKEGIKRDPEVQALEDVICFVFLKWYFAPFATTQNPEKLERIVAKTARKMSTDARARALREFDLPEPFAGSFRA